MKTTTRRDRASRQKLGEDIIGYAHQIKTIALARLGELLKQMPKAKGAERGGRRKQIDGTRKEPSNMPPTYAELGIDKKTAAVAQQLAARHRAGLAATCRASRRRCCAWLPSIPPEAEVLEGIIDHLLATQNRG